MVNSRCSFCRKHQDQVGRLVSSPDKDRRAYICNECIGACNSIFENRDDPFTGNPLADQFFSIAEAWITLEDSGQDASSQLAELRKLARMMFLNTAVS